MKEREREREREVWGGGDERKKEGRRGGRITI